MSTTTTEGPNAEAFVQTLAHIERHPEEHDQGTWVCETTMCFAGHAAITVGGLTQVAKPTWVQWPDGRQEHVADAATRVLGIPDRLSWGSAAGRLFYEAEALDDLYRISADLLGIDEQVLRDKVAAAVQS